MQRTRAPADPMRAAVTLAAAVVCFLAVYAVCLRLKATANPAIFSAVLAITLARRKRALTPARTVATLGTISGVAVAVAGVAVLLSANFALGATLFTSAMFVSIWLRNFGPRARTAGGLIALPLVAMLIAPGGAAAPGGPLVDLGLAIIAGVVALVAVTLAAWLAARAGIGLAAAEPLQVESVAAPRRSGPSPQTRMALQMAVALSTAFTAGYTMFPAHWSWAVVTAFIVCSGAHGRDDAAYKALLRITGAIGGTLAATVLTFAWQPQGSAEAVTIFVALFFGLWLRDVSYAYWAACITLVLALLTQTPGESNIELLGARIAAIFVGAVCAVAATWFVFPIKTEAIVRRRIADALRALDEFVVHEHSADAQSAVARDESRRRREAFERHVAHVETVAPPVRFHRRMTSLEQRREHPATWIELVGELPDHTHRIHAHADGGVAVRRAIGLTRRSLAEHGKAKAAAQTLSVAASLRRLRDACVNADQRPGSSQP